MPRPVHFLHQKSSNPDSQRGPYLPPEHPDCLVPEATSVEDEENPELVETLSALYWFRRQEPLEDE